MCRPGDPGQDRLADRQGDATRHAPRSCAGLADRHGAHDSRRTTARYRSPWRAGRHRVHTENLTVKFPVGLPLVRVGEGQEAGEQFDGNEVRVGDVEGLTGPVTALAVPIGMMPSDTDGSIIMPGRCVSWSRWIRAIGPASALGDRRPAPRGSGAEQPLSRTADGPAVRGGDHRAPSSLRCKNCWSIAEHAGHATPNGIQHLLAGARWMPGRAQIQATRRSHW